MRNFTWSIGLQVAAIAVLHSTSSLQAAVIYDNNVPIESSGTSVSDVDFIPPIENADDFTLAPGASTITDIHWWGSYTGDVMPDRVASEPDNFTIRFFEDLPGLPQATPLAEFHVGHVSRVDTGLQNLSTLKVYSYSVDIAPLALTPNATYWLSIVNDTTADQNDDWYWSAGGTGNSATRFVPGIWRQAGLELAFQLTNDGVAQPIPEPSTFALFAVAGVGLTLRKLRRRLASNTEY